MITFDEAKRQANIKTHGLDFIGCDAIWDNFTITREDKRHVYGEKRLVTFGLLKGDVVSVDVHRAWRHAAHYFAAKGRKV